MLSYHVIKLFFLIKEFKDELYIDESSDSQTVQSHLNEFKRFISHDKTATESSGQERRASVTKIIMVKDRRASINRLMQSANQINIANAKFVKRESRQSSSIQGYLPQPSGSTRYSVTRILPVRSRISSDEAFYMLNQQRSMSLDRSDYRRETQSGGTQTRRRFSVTKIIPISPVVEKTKKETQRVEFQVSKGAEIQQEQKKETRVLITQEQNVVEEKKVPERKPSTDTIIPAPETVKVTNITEKTTISIQPKVENVELKEVEQKKVQSEVIAQITTQQQQAVKQEVDQHVAEARSEAELLEMIETAKREEKQGKKKHVSFDVLPETVHEYKIFEEDVLEELKEVREQVSELLTDDQIVEIVEGQMYMEDNILKEMKQKSKQQRQGKL